MGSVTGQSAAENREGQAGKDNTHIGFLAHRCGAVVLATLVAVVRL